MAEATGRRYFGGKKYMRTRIGLSKREAQSAVKLARSRGHKARMIKAGKGYDIYLQLG